MLHPDLARTILDEKLDGFAAAHTTLVATGNPGCLMQIGAGVRSRQLDIEVLHPVELLDRSYAQGGLYR
jgi:glycolate oxidase iron-sulfur subunit